MQQRSKWGLSILPLLALAIAATAGCDGRPSDAANAGPYAGQRLNVLNWSDYIDPGLLEEFERQTGARVQYDNYSSDAELENKLLLGGGYDLVFPSDRSVVPLIAKGLLAELDKDQLPNLKHLDPKLLGMPADPANRHTAPYFWGTLAVGIRTDHVSEPVRGFEPLFDEKYAGHITMLDDAETSIGAALMHLGHSLNSTDAAELAAAKALLLKQRPHVLSYTSDSYKEKLLTGDAWVALGWSGDILQAAAEDERIRVVVPQAGTMIWLDSFAVTADAKNPALAHALINFLLEPKNAARNADFVRYATPNLTAREQLPPKMLANPGIYPPESIVEKCEWLKHRGEKLVRLEAIWREVLQ